MSRLLELRDVQKGLGHRSVLNGVDLEVHGGELVWLTGPNGSGKTTLLKVAAGLAPPSCGEVRWFGEPASSLLRARLGVLLDASFLYGELTAEENLLYYAKLYGLKPAREAVMHWLEQVRLHRDKHVLVKAFSKGMRQRLAIARAFLHQPDLLLLDEPYDGLDAASSHRLTGWLREFAEAGAGILLVSHDAGPFRELANRAVRLTQGRLVKGDLRCVFSVCC